MMKRKIRVAILISSRGSNMQKLIEACEKPNFPAEIIVVGSNNSNALGLEYAKSKSINTFVVESKNFAKFENSREEFDKALHQEILKYDVEIICLAGFMRLLSEWFVDKWCKKIINIHPSLLPDFKGAHAVKDALNAQVKISGCTTHFVSHEMDAGPIIMQSQVPVDRDDNFETLSQKILIKEHEIYPLTLQKICNKILEKRL
jgi:phosphoribosylglycinamide formyltransferase-1